MRNKPMSGAARRKMRREREEAAAAPQGQVRGAAEVQGLVVLGLAGVGVSGSVLPICPLGTALL